MMPSVVSWGIVLLCIPFRGMYERFTASHSNSSQMYTIYSPLRSDADSDVTHLGLLRSWNLTSVCSFGLRVIHCLAQHSSRVLFNMFIKDTSERTKVERERKRERKRESEKESIYLQEFAVITPTHSA